MSFAVDGDLIGMKTATKPTAERNLDGYDAPIIPWDKVRELLDGGFSQGPDAGGPNRHTSWLATTDPDGGPHVVPLGTFWNDGAMYFTSGPGTRKSKNLARNPRCAITVATHPYDLMLEGEAQRVTDDETLERIAQEARDGGWPARVENKAFTAEFSAPAAGPPPWYVYKLTPTRIYAMGTAEPYGATRFGF